MNLITGWYRILISSILQLACVRTEKVQHAFKVSKNQCVDLAVSKTCLISSVYKMVDLFCLASCNSNPECLTVVFDQSQEMIRNCFMYNRYFKSCELIASSNSTVYKKKAR
jgi:hypothetical protein